MGYASRNKMSDVLANAQFLTMQDDGSFLDTTSRVRLYGVMCNLYFHMKKTRPDLCPADKKNFFALGIGKTKNGSFGDMVDKLIEFAGAFGLSYTSIKMGLEIVEIMKAEMISVESMNTPQGVWTGIRLLKIAE